jgi:hypothetical protein
MATLDFKAKSNKASIRNSILWLSKIATKSQLNANIYLQTLTAKANKATMVASAATSFVLSGKMQANKRIKMKSQIIVKNLIFGQMQVGPTVTMAGSAIPTSSLVGKFTLDRRSNLNGSIVESVKLDLKVKLINIRPNFGMQASAFSFVPNTALGMTVVLNLRTKAHCLFDEATLDAYATTGELLFGSYKNKNISDAFVFGRSDDAIDLTVWNDEATSRVYAIDYKSGEQGALKNKKKALAKGLTGTNWKLKVSKTGTVSAEVRGVDLFVNELRRHV